MFERDAYSVEVFSSLRALLGHSEQTDEKAYLIEYNTLTSEERTEVIAFFSQNKHTTIFIFNVPDNAQKRLAFLELGARHVFDTSHPLEEIYYALIWPLKNLQKNNERNLLIASGSLEDVPLKTLLHNLSREERTGILKVSTPNNAGKIYFKNGKIMHASLGLHEGEKVILHMLFWKTGIFTFHITTQFEEKLTVRISLVTLLLLAEEIRRNYIKDLTELGSQSAILQLKYAGDLENSTLHIIPGFSELLTRPIAIQDIVENPFYTCFEAAEKLAELKSNGFLTITEPTIKPKEEEPHEESKIPVLDFLLLDKKMAQEFCTQLDIEAPKQVSIFVLATDSNGCYDFLANFVRTKSDIRVRDNVYSLCVEVIPEVEVTFYGIVMDEHLFEKIDLLSHNLSAMIFLFNAEKEITLEYTSYVMRYLSGLYDMPWISAVYNASEATNIGHLRSMLKIPEYQPFNIIDPTLAVDCAILLKSLKRYSAPEEEEDVVEDEA